MGRLALLSISTLFTLLVLEFAVRLFFPQQLIVLRPDVWIPSDEGIGYKHQANLDTLINTGERTVRLFTDENGYRIGDSHPQEPDMRILAVGDSFLEALQVEYDQTFAAILEHQLSDHFDMSIQVVNTGVSGYDPNHYAWTVRDELPRHEYAAVVVFIYVGNDIVSNQLTILPPRPPGQRHQFRLPRSVAFNELKNTLFYPINDELEQHSHLFILFKRSNESFLARLGLTPRYFPDAMLKSYADSPDWITTVDIFESIQVEADQYNIPTLFILLPSIYQIEEREFIQYTDAFNIDRDMVDVTQPQRILIELMESRDLLVIDTTPEFQVAIERGEDNFFGMVDTHFQPKSHQMVAEVVFPILQSTLSTN